MTETRLAYEDTTVSVERSWSHIRDLCIRYGADQLRHTEDLGGQAFAVEMLMGGVPLRLVVEYGPFAKQLRDQHPRTDRAALAKQAARAAYRWTFYWLKLAFEADHLGFQSKEAALLAGFVGPDGRTFAESVIPHLLTWNDEGVKLLGPAPAASVIEGEFHAE